MVLAMSAPVFLFWGILGIAFLGESESIAILPSSPASSIVVHNPIAVKPTRTMIAVRPPSRNTYGFVNHDYPSFDLALVELESIVTASMMASSSKTTKDGKSAKLEFIPVDESGLLFWAEGMVEYTTNDNDAKDDILARAVSQAILMHACYSMVEINSTVSNTTITTTTAASDDDGDPELDTSLAVCASIAGCDLSLATTQVVDMRNPNLSRQERLAILEAAGITNDNGKGDKIMKGTGMPATTVLLRRDDGKVHVGWRTAVGPAAGTGAPGKAPRRNYKGVLGTFALKNRLQHQATSNSNTATTTTAMEPELAFLMASFGNVQAHSHVLDPCCGSASLLLCAAAREATVLVGVDQNATAFTGAALEFDRHDLPQPQLLQGDVLAPQLTPALSSPTSLYDAILCDPPYNIGAPILVQGQDVRPRSYHDRKTSDGTGDSVRGNNEQVSSEMEAPKVVDLTAAILGIAQTTLKVGGRLVFFLPVRGDTANLPLVDVLKTHGYQELDNDDAVQTNTSSLRIVHGRLQRFSPTFSRWLVTMELSAS